MSLTHTHAQNLRRVAQLVDDAETSLCRTLSEGERRDLVADRSELSTTYIRDLIHELGEVPTVVERDALVLFAAEYGRDWKAYLRAAWLSYTYKGKHMGGADRGTLRAIRNSRGMDWLDRLNLLSVVPVELLPNPELTPARKRQGAQRGAIRTKDNTEPMDWWWLALRAFAKRGLSEPLYGETRDAYDMGELPDTWADYVLHSGPDARRELATPPATFRTSSDGVLVLGYADETPTPKRPQLADMATRRLQLMLELLTDEPNGDAGCAELAVRVAAELERRLHAAA